MQKQLIALAVAAAASAPAHAIENLKDFNPAMSVILDGVYYHDNEKGNGLEIIEEHESVLHAHAHEEEEHEHGGLDKGFNLRETEITFSGGIDPYFDAWFTAAVSDGEIEVEEAWVRTQSLPAGLQIKAGKFLSAIGYENEKHLHSWDFADQNLAQLSLFGDHGLTNTGAQLTWLAESDSFLQFGVEVAQCDELEKFGTSLEDYDEIAEELDGIAGRFDPDGDGELTAAELGLEDANGPDLTVGFVRFGPDLGTDHALQLGASIGHHSRMQSLHEEDSGEAFVAEGDGTVYGLHAVYKRFATGAYGQGALSLQAEYFSFSSDQDATYHTDEDEIGLPLEMEQDAAYVQATYGFAPRWSFGVRTAAAGIGAEFTEGTETDKLRISRQHSAALTFRPSEFSMLRLQGNRNEIGLEDRSKGFNQVMLQYNISLGAHGAHTF